MVTSCQLEITEDEFQKFAELIYNQAGIRLKDTKKYLLKSRLNQRLQRLNISRFQNYYDRVLSDSTGREISYLLEAISTNVTSFFREPKHFDYLKNTVIPEILDGYNSSSENSYIHFWSTACSTGQEPYSMAMDFADAVGDMHQYDFRILGTDISRKALRSARQGVYSKSEIADLDSSLRSRYFKEFDDGGESKVRIKDFLRERLSFGRLNLTKTEYPFSRKFDAIFCRNVTIYFDEPVIQKLINRLEQYLKPNGYLFMGHSESLAGIDHDLEYEQATVYRRTT